MTVDLSGQIIVALNFCCISARVAHAFKTALWILLLLIVPRWVTLFGSQRRLLPQGSEFHMACGEKGNKQEAIYRQKPATVRAHVCSTISEQEFQSELDKPRIVDRIIHDSKGSRLKEGLWRGKLRMVEEVEELSPELEAHPFARAKGRSLEYGEIKIDDTLLAKAGIYARLVSECERIRLRET